MEILLYKIRADACFSTLIKLLQDLTPKVNDAHFPREMRIV